MYSFSIFSGPALRTLAAMMFVWFQVINLSVSVGQAADEIANAPTLTPLQSLSYARMPNSSEIDAYLANLAESSEFIRLERIGRSSTGKPLHALFISSGPTARQRSRAKIEKLTILLVAGQHGDESSGTEALQQVIAEIANGKLRRYLDRMNFILVPNANPDGFDKGSRVNGNTANINGGYVLLEQPESLALAKLLQRYRPHVVLDIHEAAALKPKALGRQGFLVDFEAQFDIATHQAVHPALRNFAYSNFLPAVIDEVNTKGHRAQRYISAVMDINQPITHGRLWLRNLRNYAGVRGALSVLMENRLDPDGDYPTPGNIAVRARKQLTGLYVFLEECRLQHSAILERAGLARRSAQQESTQPIVYLGAYYGTDAQRPVIKLPLRLRKENRPVERMFEYRSRLIREEELALPSAYFVTAHQKRISAFLDKHGITYERIVAPISALGVGQSIKSIRSKPQEHLGGALDIRVREHCWRIRLRKGDLRVTPRSEDARLTALLLEPRSSNSIFQTKAYQDLLVADQDFFISREVDCHYGS